MEAAGNRHYKKPVQMLSAHLPQLKCKTIELATHDRNRMHVSSFIHSMVGSTETCSFTHTKKEGLSPDIGCDMGEDGSYLYITTGRC